MNAICLQAGVVLYINTQSSSGVNTSCPGVVTTVTDSSVYNKLINSSGDRLTAYCAPANCLMASFHSLKKIHVHVFVISH